MDKQFTEAANCLFVGVDLMDNLLLKLKSFKEFNHTEKMLFNRAKDSLKHFVKMINNTLPEGRIDEFDKDKEVLLRLLEADIRVYKEGREKEFKEYLEKFFEK